MEALINELNRQIAYWSVEIDTQTNDEIKRFCRDRLAEASRQLYFARCNEETLERLAAGVE